MAVVAATIVVLAGCSAGDGPEEGAEAAGDRTTTSAPASVPDRPEGPAADLSEELTAGGQPFLADLSTTDLDAMGYVQHEYVAAGTATSYRANGELPADGTFDLVEGESADYRTRIVVRRPAEASDSNGTVVLEWLNVSGGLDFQAVTIDPSGSCTEAG